MCQNLRKVWICDHLFDKLLAKHPLSKKKNSLTPDSLRLVKLGRYAIEQRVF